MISAVALAVLSSSLFYLGSPRFPPYKVISLRPYTAWDVTSPLKFLWTGGTLTVHVEADLQINNTNFIGAEVHAAVVDLYHPDWNGELASIGNLKESHTFRYYEELLEHENASPIHVPPLQTISLNKAVVSVNVSPKTYLQLFRSAFTSLGTIDVLSVGVMHIKPASMVGEPTPQLTIEVICDQRMDIVAYPADITDRVCTAISIMPGWVDMNTRRLDLAGQISRRWSTDGTILTTSPADYSDWHYQNFMFFLKQMFLFLFVRVMLKQLVVNLFPIPSKQ